MNKHNQIIKLIFLEVWYTDFKIMLLFTGALHAGCGATKVNKLLKTMDIPGMSPNTFKIHERVVGPVIEHVAKETCAEAVLLEKIATIENIEELKKML